MKLTNEKNIIKKAKAGLVSAVAGIPFIKIQDTKLNVKFDNKEIDLLVNVLISGKPATFVVEVKSRGEPRTVRLAASQIKDYRRAFSNSYGILIAPYISEASREICKEAGIGCIDLAGNVYISFKNIFIDRSGIPNPFAVPRISKSVFSPKSSRVLRVLLSDPTRRWFVEDMSNEAGISIGLVSRVKRSLLEKEWIREENRKFYLVNPDQALTEWADDYSYSRSQSSSFYSGLSDDQLEKAIKKECNRRKWTYGIALFSGAKKVAPFVRFLRFFAYIEGDIDALSESLKLKRVETGPNVILLEPYDKGVFYGLRNINGMNVVSDIQLYLDLRSYRGRGEEAAQAILEQRIKPGW